MPPDDEENRRRAGPAEAAVEAEGQTVPTSAGNVRPRPGDLLRTTPVSVTNHARTAALKRRRLRRYIKEPRNGPKGAEHVSRSVAIQMPGHFYQLETTPTQEVFPGFTARMLHSAHMTFAFWHIAAGSLLPEHRHPHEQVAILLEGRFELTVDGETSVLVSGTVAVIASNAQHSGRALSDCRICDVFYPVREDYVDHG